MAICSLYYYSDCLFEETVDDLFLCLLLGETEGHELDDLVAGDLSNRGLMDKARVVAIPELEANDLDSALVHEAAIGKIAGDQIIKLMTLGLTEEEAEEQIINGFLR